MITLCAIPDIDDFLKVVDSCEGPVIVSLPEAGDCDLRHDASARGMLRAAGKDGAGGLSVSTALPRDAARFVRYLMECLRRDEPRKAG